MDVIHQIWPNWTTVDEIGAGAFGKVYKVKREDLGNVSYSAVKVMHIPRDNSEVNDLHRSGMDFQSIHSYFEDMVKNLLNEIQIMESLKSASNIVAIEDYEVVSREGEIGWDIYIRMELLQDLGTFLTERGMTRQQIIRLGMDMCQALIACEQENIIHRDIKLDNIFFNGFNSFKLGDFGISKQLEKTQSALSQKGTNMYMAPEVFRAEKYDATVDIYSLGIVLYRLLNKGRFPFQPPAEQQMLFDDTQRAMEQRLSGAKMPAPAMADDQLAAIVLKACAYQAADRYQSAGEMFAALRQYQQTVQYDAEKLVIVINGSGGTHPSRPKDTPKPSNGTISAFGGDPSQDVEQSNTRNKKLTPPIGKDIGGNKESDEPIPEKKAGFGRKQVKIAGVVLLVILLGVTGFLTVRYLTRDTSGLAKEYTTIHKLQISARLPKGWNVDVDEDQAVATYKKGKVSKSISISMDFRSAALEDGAEDSVSLQSVEEKLQEKDNGLAPDGASEKYAHIVLRNTAWKLAALGNNFEDALEESRLYTINGRDYYYLQSNLKYGDYSSDTAYYYTVQDAAQIYYLFSVTGAKITKEDRKLFDSVMESVRMDTKGIKYYNLKARKVDPYALSDKSTTLKGKSLSVCMPKEYQIAESDNGVVGTYKHDLTGSREVSVTVEQQDWIGDFADGMNDTIAAELLKQLEAQGKTINHKEHVIVGSRPCYAVGNSDSTGRSFTYYSVYQGKLLAFTYKVSGNDASLTINDNAKEMLKNMITGAAYQ